MKARSSVCGEGHIWRAVVDVFLWASTPSPATLEPASCNALAPASAAQRGPRRGHAQAAAAAPARLDIGGSGSPLPLCKQMGTRIGPLIGQCVCGRLSRALPDRWSTQTRPTSVHRQSDGGRGSLLRDAACLLFRSVEASLLRGSACCIMSDNAVAQGPAQRRFFRDEAARITTLRTLRLPVHTRGTSGVDLLADSYIWYETRGKPVECTERITWMFDGWCDSSTVHRLASARRGFDALGQFQASPARAKHVNAVNGCSGWYAPAALLRPTAAWRALSLASPLLRPRSALVRSLSRSPPLSLSPLRRPLRPGAAGAADAASSGVVSIPSSNGAAFPFPPPGFSFNAPLWSCSGASLRGWRGRGGSRQRWGHGGGAHSNCPPASQTPFPVVLVLVVTTLGWAPPLPVPVQLFSPPLLPVYLCFACSPCPVGSTPWAEERPYLNPRALCAGHPAVGRRWLRPSRRHCGAERGEAGDKGRLVV